MLTLINIGLVALSIMLSIIFGIIYYYSYIKKDFEVIYKFNLRELQPIEDYCLIIFVLTIPGINVIAIFLGILVNIYINYKAK